MYRILVVDDDKNERNVIKYLLDKYQFNLQVIEASNGKEAYQYLSENYVDLLFTDVKMPFLNGIELARAAKNLYPELQIVFFSGYDDFEFVKEALSLRAVDYILKPVNPEEFRNTISNVLERMEEQQIKSETTNQANRAELDSPPLSHSIQLVTQYIKEHYGDELNLELLAKEVHLTPHYLSSTFIQETGCGINKYIKRIRMEKAKDLLLNTNEKINDIGNTVGYTNMSYFCLSFREYFGLTPAKYRQRHY